MIITAEEFKANLAAERLKATETANPAPATPARPQLDYQALYSATRQESVKIRAERDEALSKLTKLEAEHAELKTDYSELVKKLVGADARIELRASMKALEITASQGVPPVGSSSGPFGTTWRQKYDAETDNAAKAKLWAEHRDEILEGK